MYKRQHEANALPGVSNRMVAQKVDKFLLAVPEAEKHLPPRPDYIVTGLSLIHI